MAQTPCRLECHTTADWSNLLLICILTPLANRLVTPVGAMRSFKLNDTEQAQLLGVLGGDVSAVRSATGAGLCDTSFIYPVTVAVSAKCSDSLSLWMRSNPPKIFLKRGNTHTLFQFEELIKEHKDRFRIFLVPVLDHLLYFVSEAVLGISACKSWAGESRNITSNYAIRRIRNNAAIGGNL